MVLFYLNFTDITGCRIIECYWLVFYMKTVFQNLWILNQTEFQKWSCESKWLKWVELFESNLLYACRWIQENFKF